MMAGMHSRLLIIAALLMTTSGCAGGAAGSASTASGGEAAGGGCDVVGTWVGLVPAGVLAGRPLTMVFSEDGTAQGTCDRVTLNSRWQRDGNRVEVIDVSATPAFAQCDPALVGRYTLEFGDDCQSVHSVSGEDACAHRRLALVDFRAERR